MKHPAATNRRRLKKNTTTKRKNKSMKTIASQHSSSSQETISRTIKIMLEMLTTIKLYHWNTQSYAQHKATDELHEKLSTNIDTFVEVYLGKKETRIHSMEKVLDVYSGESLVDFKEKIHEYRRFFINMNRVFVHEEDSDLLTIRDEILIHLNQFLYLMTFH